MSYNPQNPNGQTTSANSAPVVIASDQSAVSVSASALPLPTGAATAANQTAANTTLTSIDTKTPALGQSNMAGSMPVTIASNQSAIPISGTVSIGGGGIAQDATLTNGTQTARITDGTTTANVQAVATGQNALSVAGSYKELSGLSAGSLNADLVPSTDVSTFRLFSLHITGTYVATLSFQGSNDNTNWVSVVAENLSNSTTSYVISTSLTNVIFTGPLQYRYFRVRATSYTSGTATGIVEFYTTPPVGNIASVAQSGTWTVQPGNTANTTPWLVRDSDGTNSVTIKAASTAAAAGDTAEVVALSPNTPLPTGTNIIGGVQLKTATSGGPTVARIMSAASTNATSVKASAGQIYSWYLANNAAYDVFIKFYNKASAPTVGTDTPLFTIKVPMGGAANVEFSLGVPFSTGIAYAITKSVTDSDTTAVVANDVSGFFTYA